MGDQVSQGTKPGEGYDRNDQAVDERNIQGHMRRDELSEHAKDKEGCFGFYLILSKWILSCLEGPLWLWSLLHVVLDSTCR